VAGPFRGFAARLAGRRVLRLLVSRAYGRDSNGRQLTPIIAGCGKLSRSGQGIQRSRAPVESPVQLVQLVQLVPPHLRTCWGTASIRRS